jgi:hypothetical protein
MTETESISEVGQLINEIKQLRLQITNLELKVDNTNGVLINHIGFINNVFDMIKKPLFFIVNRINSVFLLENKKMIPLIVDNNHS